MRSLWFVLLLAVAAAAQMPVLGQRLGTAPASQVRALAQTGSTVEEVHAATGNVIRAFVAPNGVVFGLAWEGPTVPNLSQLLGSYFAAFQAAAHQPRRRGPLYVQAGELVVQISGHMRDLRGRAYLANAVPANLTPEVVR